MWETGRTGRKSVLVVENDSDPSTNTAREIKRVMASLSCKRAIVQSAEECRFHTLTNEVAAAILCEWNADAEGQSSIASIRELLPSIPILIIGVSDSEDARVAAFDAGADQYVATPCSSREIISRVSGMLRREDVVDNALTISDLKVWKESRVVLRSGRTIKLSGKEMDILLYLAKNRSRPVARADILKDVFRLDFEPGTNAVEVHIHRLRQKIDSGHSHRLLNTIRGVGYVLG